MKGETIMKRYFVILSTALILAGLLGYPSLSPAQQVPPGGKWAQKADMPTPRSDLCVAAANALIYAFGGRDTKNVVRLATVEVYNPATDTWKKLGDMPTAREEFATAVVGGKIYLFGGFSSVKRGARTIVKTLNTIDVYDPAADAWEQKGKAPNSRSRMTANALNGKIYVISGVTNVGGGRQLLEIYDPAADKWEKGPDLIEPRWALSSGVANGKLYAIGGFRKENHEVEIVEEYDPATNTWVRKKDLPTPRFYAGVHAGAAGGRIYMIGGLDHNQLTKVVEEYDPAKDAWTARVKMPTNRMAFDTAVVRGKLYVIGGIAQGGKRNGEKMEDLAGTEQHTGIVEEYTPPGWPFAVSPQGKLATTWGTIKSTD
jgi:N-acetylneuraminic acid mutarotase